MNKRNTKLYLPLCQLCVLIAAMLVLLLVGKPFIGRTQAHSPQQSPPDPTLVLAVQEALTDLLGSIPSADIIVSNVRYADMWAFGTTAIPASTSHSQPQGFLFLGRRSVGEWEAAIEGTTAFQSWLSDLPKGLLSPAEHTILASSSIKISGNGAAQLSLPWAIGETWTLTGGPHGEIGEALDFAGGSGNVRAARDGIAFLPCANQVDIYHSDGWRTGYYHLTDIKIENGQEVSRGTLLGKISAEYGCESGVKPPSGPHVHFWTSTTSLQPIAGQDIGGWTVHSGNQEYEGCMTKNGNTQCAGNGQIYNDGTIGSGTGGQLSGYIDRPQPNATRSGIVRIDGWAKVTGSTISRVEIWIDGTKRADATYGTSRPDAGGNVGWQWDWDTTKEGNGT